MNNKAILILLIMASVTLMQYHAIQFWSAHVDIKTGWAWSIMLESASLWLWWQRSTWWRGVGFVASILLLGGPLYQISSPLFHASDLIGNVETEISSLESTLETARNNSRERLGWLTTIQSTETKLEAARDKREALMIKHPSTGLWAVLVVVMQALALIVIWLVSVSAISRISKSPKKDGNAFPSDVYVEMEVESGMETSCAEEETMEIIQDLIPIINARLDAVLQRTGLTQGAWADEHNFNRRDLSFIRKHFERERNRERIASDAVIHRLAKTLGVKY